MPDTEHPNPVACSITVDTSVCSFDDASKHAEELAKTFVHVQFAHGNLTIQAHWSWTAEEIRSAWIWAQLVKQGRVVQ